MRSRHLVGMWGWRGEAGWKAFRSRARRAGRRISGTSITLNPDTEARLRETAMRDGVEPDALAETIIAEALAWEAQDRQEAIESIRRGLEANDAGRVRPFAEFAAEMRARYNLPAHLTEEELQGAQ